MSKKQQLESSSPQIPVSKQTASGVAGAVVGGVIGGPIGAVVGGVAGAIMANRAARGEPILPKGAVKKAETALSSARKALPRARAASAGSAKPKRNAGRTRKKSNPRASRVGKKKVK
jgi:hypothetical protein